MRIYKSQTFEHEEVPIDDSHFQDCQFIHCNMVYSGGAFRFDDPITFEGCRWELRGLAADTADFLHQLYTRKPAEAEKLMQSIWDGPRKLPGPH